MSTQGKTISADSILTQRITVVPLLFAVVLGSSLIEFRDFLIPSTVASLNFWALVIVYLSAFASWFGYQEAALRYPYTRRPIARLRAAIEAMGAINWAFLLFFATKAADSLFGYLWAFVMIFIFMISTYIVRRREWHVPEASYSPLGSTIKHGAVMLAAAAAYSIWALLFAPIPEAAIWVFVFVPLAITVSIRLPQYLRELPSGIPGDQQ